MPQLDENVFWSDDFNIVGNLLSGMRQLWTLKTDKKFQSEKPNAIVSYLVQVLSEMLTKQMGACFKYHRNSSALSIELQ